MILTSVIVGERQQLSVLSTKAATWAQLSHYRKLLLQLSACCIIFSSTLLHVYRMKKKTIQKIMSQSLTFPSSCILLTLLGRSISRTIAFSTLPSVYSYSLLVRLRLGNEKKKKQHFLTGTHNSCQRDSAVKTKCSIVSNREGEKKKNIFCFWYLTWVWMRFETEAVTELGWLKAWENNISWEVFKDSRNNWVELNIKYSMERILTEPVFLNVNLQLRLLLDWKCSLRNMLTLYITENSHHIQP